MPGTVCAEVPPAPVTPVPRGVEGAERHRGRCRVGGRRPGRARRRTAALCSESRGFDRHRGVVDARGGLGGGLRGGGRVARRVVAAAAGERHGRERHGGEQRQRPHPRAPAADGPAGPSEIVVASCTEILSFASRRHRTGRGSVERGGGRAGRATAGSYLCRYDPAATRGPGMGRSVGSEAADAVGGVPDRLCSFTTSPLLRRGPELPVTGVDADVVRRGADEDQVAGLLGALRDRGGGGLLLGCGAREAPAQLAVDVLGEARAVEAVRSGGAVDVRLTGLRGGDADGLRVAPPPVSQAARLTAAAPAKASAAMRVATLRLTRGSGGGDGGELDVSRRARAQTIPSRSPAR